MEVHAHGACIRRDDAVDAGRVGLKRLNGFLIRGGRASADVSQANTLPNEPFTNSSLSLDPFRKDKQSPAISPGYLELFNDPSEPLKLCGRPHLVGELPYFCRCC
ncbi:MAG: hypothetical protein JW395_3639 [Nitrospira sp.]|nr:hypothetical protein [Nitrospira sp.]